jgi:hypothetical protein
VGYAPKGVQEYQILIEADTPAPPMPSVTQPDDQQVNVRGHNALVAPLTDEGRQYGFSVTWDERADLRIYIEGSELTEPQTLAVARGVRTVSESDWQRLLVELSPDTHEGKVDPHATPIEAARGTVAGEMYTLTALIPGGFPLGPDDQRADCFHLSFAGQTTSDECPGVPVWARVGGQPFVFGTIDLTITKLRVVGVYGHTFVPFTVDTTRLATGPPTRFYVARLPEGACAINLQNADGPGGPGTTGPLMDTGADYTRCTGLRPGQPPLPPTTAP